MSTSETPDQAPVRDVDTSFMRDSPVTFSTLLRAQSAMAYAERTGQQEAIAAIHAWADKITLPALT